MSRDYISKPGQMIDDGIASATQHAVGALAPKLLKGLAMATEPFFRKNFGERYLDSGAIGAGFLLWIAATIMCGFGGMAVAIFVRLCGLRSLANIFERGNGVSVLIGIIISVVFVVLCKLDQFKARQRHILGQRRHSMSRGEPRFSNQEYHMAAQAGLFLLLLGFASPLGVLFLFSWMANNVLIAKQQEALYARYLDSIDAQIEAEQLEAALLGQTNVANTYLYKPLSEHLPDAMRTEIAAAAVGKVKVVARAPQTACQLSVEAQ